MKCLPGPDSLGIVNRGDRSRQSRTRAALSVLAIMALSASSCGGDSEGEDASPAAPATPTILVTTGIWADVVSNVACGGLADIETIIPVGGDPHGYEPSLRDRERMENAALVVANGLELEEGLEDTLEQVRGSGTPVFKFAEGMEPIPFAFEGGHHGEEEEGDDQETKTKATTKTKTKARQDEDEGHDEDDDEGHDEDEGEEGHGSGGDPHVWFDPHRVSEALPGLAGVLTTRVGLDAAAIDACLASYLAELEAVDAEIAIKVEQLPAESRKLVTSHEALGYFADRYGFELIGTVIPTPSSMAQTNPAQLEELAEIIEHEGIKAIFAETLHSVDDVKALASRVGDVEVVTLYTGSLGPSGSGAETYLGFLSTNADLIVDALG